MHQCQAKSDLNWRAEEDVKRDQGRVLRLRGWTCDKIVWRRGLWGPRDNKRVTIFLSTFNWTGGIVKVTVMVMPGPRRSPSQRCSVGYLNLDSVQGTTHRVHEWIDEQRGRSAGRVICFWRSLRGSLSRFHFKCMWWLIIMSPLELIIISNTVLVVVKWVGGCLARV